MIPQPHVLIVEDDPEMASVLRQGFEQEQLHPAVAGDGDEGLRLALSGTFQAIVLDVMLPLRSGFEVARFLRREGNHTPILFLTARDSVADVVHGLDCGAEDYLTKPFSFLELMARVRALIRRNPPAETRLCVGDLWLDPLSHEVVRGAETIQLTRTECKLLEALMRQAGRLVSRRDLVAAVWGAGTHVGENTLDVSMSALRNRIDKGRQQRMIRTIRGLGYRLEAEPPTA
jgi:DNA-binding response OmpR family regulator